MARHSRTHADGAVIGECLWHTQFGGDPAIVGKSIPLDGKPVTVIGVAPASFQILYQSELWTLMTPKRSPEQRRRHYLQVLGRLKPGVTVEQARSAMGVIAGQIAEISPATNKDWGVTIDPLRESIVGSETAHHHPGAGRSGGVHPPDGVRQCGQPDAGARRGAGAGNGGAGIAGRGRRAAGEAVADRKPAAGPGAARADWA